MTHYFWAVTGDQRMTQCASVITQLGQAIVFCRTRRGADRVARQLEAEGITSVAIHGDRSQAQRERALRAFERGEAQALVATDVAARGIHLEALPGVIHFDPPADATDYTHRSGRTGRAGCDGIVISMVVSDQKRAVGNIQKALGLQRQLTEPVVLDVEPRIPTPPKRDPRSRDRGARDQVREDREPRRGPREDRGQRQSREDRWPKRRPTDGDSRAERPRREGSWDRPSDSRASHGGRGPTGIVKFYNADKGYGFVARQGQDDLFVHASGLPASVNGRLEEGQIVAFEIGKGKRGDEARNVRIVSGAKSGSGRDKRPMAAAGKRKGRN